MNNDFYIFSKTEWPVDMKNAEEVASKSDYDTLLFTQKEGRGMGRGKNRVWCLGIENEPPSLISIIQYENRYNRKVILWSEDMTIAYEAYQKLFIADWNKEMDCEVPEYLCHSTTLDSFVKIVEDGYIYSYNELKKRKRNIKTIRGFLKEPEDYFDYIDLSELSSFAPENVVASREHGKLNVDLDQEYTPGARIYFKGEDLIKLPGIVRIGKRSLKAHKMIDISLAELIVVPNEAFSEFDKKEIEKKRQINIIAHLQEAAWTPRKYSEKSNELLKKH